MWLRTRNPRMGSPKNVRGVGFVDRSGFWIEDNFLGTVMRLAITEQGEYISDRSPAIAFIGNNPIHQHGRYETTTSIISWAHSAFQVLVDDFVTGPRVRHSAD